MLRRSETLYAVVSDGAATHFGSILPSLGVSDFTAIGSGDLNGDGQADAVFQYAANGGIFYKAAGDLNTGWGAVAPLMPAGWHAGAVGDFNGDAIADVAVQEPATGNTFFADMAVTNVNMTPPGGSGATAWGVGALTLSSDWVLKGAGDVTGDGLADLVFQSTSTGVTIYADMAEVNAAVAASNYGALPATLHVLSSNLGTGYTVAGIGDVNGDGIADVVFHGTADGAIVFAPGGAGANPTYQNIGALPTDWSVAGLADVDGDGYRDVLVQDQSAAGARRRLLHRHARHVGGRHDAFRDWSPSVSGTISSCLIQTVVENPFSFRLLGAKVSMVPRKFIEPTYAFLVSSFIFRLNPPRTFGAPLEITSGCRLRLLMRSGTNRRWVGKKRAGRGNLHRAISGVSA